MRNLLFLALLGLLSQIPMDMSGQAKVLILGMDGTRPDALQAAYTPNIDGLVAESTYSWDALTEGPTWSGVGWSGMLTGVWRNKHGVDNNSFTGQNFAAYPHFLKHIEDHDPSLYTVSISHWAPISTAIVGNLPVDLVLSPSSDTLVGLAAVDVLTNGDPDVIFLHFDDVDHAGHSYGFLPGVPEYLAAIEHVDRQIGNVLTALKARSNYLNEDWLIIGSTDHGGTSSGHGGNSFDERNIFYYASRAGNPQVQISKSQLVTNSNCYPDSMGLRMDGSGDYASVPNNSAFQFGASQDFTLELRIKATGWVGDPSFLGNKNWNSGVNSGFVISTPSGSSSSWKVNVGDGSNRADVNGGIIADNLWHHLAASFDRDGMLNIFQDGVAVGNTSLGSVGNINNGLALGIGQDGSLTYGSDMAGLIGEVRIWRTLVDSATIANWQCQPLNNTHPNYSDLVGYWRMNEGTGSLLNDDGPNNLDAQYNGSASDWEAVQVLDTTDDFSNTPRVVDVAVTALNHMCVPINPAWGLDGQSVGVEQADPQISGDSLTCQLANETYSITLLPGQSASWSVANGLILQGQDSSSVVVQWGGAGPAEVVVQQCGASDTLPITINVCTALEGDFENLELSLVPNPVSGRLKISWEDKKTLLDHVQLLDLQGRVLLEAQPQSKFWTLDVSGIPAGMYWVWADSPRGRVTKALQIR